MKNRSLLSELNFKGDDDISVSPLMTYVMIRKKDPKASLIREENLWESDLHWHISIWQD
jgi:hypothetical protein